MLASTPFFCFVPVSLGISGFVSSVRIKRREERETKQTLLSITFSQSKTYLNKTNVRTNE